MWNKDFTAGFTAAMALTPCAMAAAIPARRSSESSDSGDFQQRLVNITTFVGGSTNAACPGPDYPQQWNYTNYGLTGSLSKAVCWTSNTNTWPDGSSGMSGMMLNSFNITGAKAHVTFYVDEYCEMEAGDLAIPESTQSSCINTHTPIMDQVGDGISMGWKGFKVILEV